ISDAEAMIESGVISGGMIPKVRCCIDALNEGVKASVIIDGRVPHATLMEILTNEGAGTMFKRG
ncbi:MAG: acetylglutamate kinase, partial [Solobacterium sp.]|nr:acetylglutamate kinase [Solobacterium sp.]